MQTQRNQLHLKITSDPAEIAEVRKSVESFAAQRGFSEESVASIGLVLNEALANIIRHAYENTPDKPIEISAHIDERSLTISLRDWGNGKLPDLTKNKENLLAPGGLGLICLKQMTDKIQFTPQTDGMLLTMVKHRG